MARERKLTGVTHLSAESVEIADALKGELTEERGVSVSRSQVIKEALPFFRRYRLEVGRDRGVAETSLPMEEDGMS